MAKNKVIKVKGVEISLLSKGDSDYISLTDIAKSRDNAASFAVINN
jgi:hypothetical protein